jgi:hypothetical protein
MVNGRWLSKADIDTCSRWSPTITAWLRPTLRRPGVDLSREDQCHGDVGKRSAVDVPVHPRRSCQATAKKCSRSPSCSFGARSCSRMGQLVGTHPAAREQPFKLPGESSRWTQDLRERSHTPAAYTPTPPEDAARRRGSAILQMSGAIMRVVKTCSLLTLRRGAVGSDPAGRRRWHRSNPKPRTATNPPAHQDYAHRGLGACGTFSWPSPASVRGAAGSSTVTRSPPAARGVRVRVPSCAWVMLLTIARPRPTPAWSVRMRSVPR